MIQPFSHTSIKQPKLRMFKGNHSSKSSTASSDDIPNQFVPCTTGGVEVNFHSIKKIEKGEEYVGCAKFSLIRLF